MPTGEVVNAACVNEAADRQVTPSKKGGVDVLLVQRGFTDGFRPDLVGVQACLGLTGSLFRAVDCNGEDELASLVDGELKTPSGACQSGHNDKVRREGAWSDGRRLPRRWLIWTLGTTHRRQIGGEVCQAQDDEGASNQTRIIKLDVQLAGSGGHVLVRT